MTKKEHLLTILSEECIETAQRVSKALRFGLQEIQPGQELTNAQRIVYEFNDILAMMEMLQSENAFNHHINGPVKDGDAIVKKKKKVEKFLELSKECGTLTEPDEVSKCECGEEKYLEEFKNVLDGNYYCPCGIMY